MSSKVVQSRFVSGPNDRLAVSDVYEVKTGAVKTRARGSAVDAVGNLLAALRRPKGQARGASSSMELDSADKALFDALLTRINATISRLPLEFRNFLGETGFTVTQDALGFAGLGVMWDYKGMGLGLTPDNQSTAEAARASIAVSRKRSGNAAQFTPTEGTLDQGAEAFVYSELLKRMMGQGMAGPMDEILDSLSDDTVRQVVSESVFSQALNPAGQDGPTAKEAWMGGTLGNVPERPLHRPTYEVSDRFESMGKNEKNLLTPGYRDNAPPWVRSPDRSKTGVDWDSVEVLKKHASPARLKAQYPGLLSMFLYYYLYPFGSYDLSEEYNQLVGTLNWLDADWARVERDETGIGKLSHFSSASEDALDLFTRYPESEYRDEACMASSFRYSSISALLNNQYPKAGL